MSLEKPNLPYGPHDPRHILLRSFIRRLFEAEDQSLPLGNISEVAREELKLGDVSDEQVRSIIRYVGANFFRIFDIEQPRSAKKYKEVMGQIHDEVMNDVKESDDEAIR